MDVDPVGADAVMITVTVLGSGSRGNAILVDGTEGTVLVDAGFGTRALPQRMALVDRKPTEVQALLLTHEHTDHASGARPAQTRWGWPVYAVPETLTALASQPSGAPEHLVPLQFDQPGTVGGFAVTSVRVPHDAQACTSYVLTDMASGCRVGIALDVGHVTEPLVSTLAHCDLLVLESNHDEQMLANGPYPWHLKQRVGGALGHLANGATASLASQLVHRGLRGVILAHLSETNNTPAAAIQRTRDALHRKGWQRDGLWAASQSVPCGPVGANGLTHRHRAAQLSLGF